MAQLYFYQKRYDKVLEQLRFVEYDDISYNLNSKAMLIATYYELDELDLLDSHLDTFNTFIKRRRDLTEGRKAPYKALIRFTKKMTRLIPKDTKAIDKLRAEIKAHPNIANVAWLLEKIKELE